MTDNEIINIGDVCIYSYFEENRSISIVEVVKELSEETVVIKFHQVIFDNSGNDLFFYLCKTGRTMNASKKYLRKIDLINRLKVENEALISAQETLQKHIEKQNEAYPCKVNVGNNCLVYAKSLDDYDNLIGDISAEAIKEFAERLKKYSELYSYVTPRDIDNLVKEMVGDK